MEDDKKTETARKLIDAFAADLLSLQGGKVIPRSWKNYLLRAIKPLPRKRGAKRDYSRVAEIVKRLALDGDSMRKESTKHHHPAKHKDKVAKDIGVSRKTVDRIEAKRPHVANEFSRMDSLEPEERRAYMEGMAAAISELLKADDEAEDKARKREMEQKHSRFVSGLK